MDSSTKKFTIVAADHSPLQRKLVEDTLAGQSCDLILARNGQEALKLVAEHRPAVLITSWEMPDLTGIQLCQEIRREFDCYTYIILLTGNTQKDQIIEGLASGADDYLTKPFHPGELLARVAVGRRIADLHRQIQTKNRLLEQLALTDSLTGLPNRRAVEEWAVRELRAAVRYRFPFCVAITDLDRFKSVNDTYGHEAGDTVLKRFAELLRANTRSSNICGRIGGEEFVIILSHCDRADAATVIERIRRALESEVFTFQNAAVRVTASFGVAGFHGGQAPELSQLFREADAALYVAKGSGRNRIEFAPPDPPAPVSFAAHC